MTNTNFTMHIFIGERKIVEALNIQLMVHGKNILSTATSLKENKKY